jgi:hypothetical protein
MSAPLVASFRFRPASRDAPTSVMRPELCSSRSPPEPGGGGIGRELGVGDDEPLRAGPARVGPIVDGEPARVQPDVAERDRPARAPGAHAEVAGRDVSAPRRGGRRHHDVPPIAADLDLVLGDDAQWPVDHDRTLARPERHVVRHLQIELGRRLQVLAQRHQRDVAGGLGDHFPASLDEDRRGLQQHPAHQLDGSRGGDDEVAADDGLAVGQLEHPVAVGIGQDHVAGEPERLRLVDLTRLGRGLVGDGDGRG